MSAFEHCVYASSTETRIPSFGTDPSTALGARSSRSSVIAPRPLTRNESPTPGIRKMSPMDGSASRFVSVSAIRFPGRSGISSSRSPRMRTNPGGSPRGETSMPPFGIFVATQTNGERSMNCLVSSLRRSEILETTTSLGEPMIARSSASFVIVRTATGSAPRRS
jgi:hypothetical protein